MEQQESQRITICHCIRDGERDMPGVLLRAGPPLSQPRTIRQVLIKAKQEEREKGIL